MKTGNLLIIANFSSGTGYAWNTISEYFVALGRLFSKHGAEVVIAYPRVDTVLPCLKTESIRVAEFDFSKSGWVELFRFIRRNRICAIYLTDRSVFSLKYGICRLAGVRRIIVHDRTSGERRVSGRTKRWLKRLINAYPLISADGAVAISEYVRRRLIEVSCFPSSRTFRIWNGVNIQKFNPGRDDFAHRKYGISPDRKIVFAYSRACRYKGIEVFIEAAEILVKKAGRTDLYFLFCGEGPDLEHFRSIVADRHLEDHVGCPGKSEEIHRILKGVHVVVVPSLWQEGFGLSVVEAMASGRVVIASRVGGIPEIVRDGMDGYLFDPGDARALASRILEVLDRPDRRRAVEEAARQRAVECFDIREKEAALCRFFEERVLEGSVLERE